MIYIFQGVRSICGLPGLLCSECSNLCKQINCRPLQECCDAAAHFCQGFLDKPLSSYVLLTAALSIAELLACANSLNSPQRSGCVAITKGFVHVGLHNWLILQIGFAGLNLLFAPYFQAQVWRHLEEEVKSFAGTTKVAVPKKVVQESFKHVFLHDFGVLFYFLALLLSFMWSMKGRDLSRQSSLCNPDGTTDWAAWIGMSLFWVAFFYSVFWYWCESCARSVEGKYFRQKPQYSNEKASAAPTASQALYHGQRGSQNPQSSLAPGAGYSPVR
mmetsp:Transcript_6844/g.16164  ORF Transcript_6844/g.16164 Transcript_6844/m.16164 type:complete len:273 (+) Transcript_6844:70-888(+)